MLDLLTVSFFGVYAADVLITYPAGGEVLSGLNEYTVTWTESNVIPLISDLDSYKLFLYAGTNENYVCPPPSPSELFSPSDKHETKMFASNPGNFTQTTKFSNTLALYDVIGPNSNNNAYFLGVVSNLKANNSIQIVNFSNRFSITDMDTSLSFDPPVPDNGLSPPAAREFECGSDICSSEVALAGLKFTTPSAAPITSLPVLYPGLTSPEVAMEILLTTL